MSDGSRIKKGLAFVGMTALWAVGGIVAFAILAVIFKFVEILFGTLPAIIMAVLLVLMFYGVYEYGKEK